MTIRFFFVFFFILCTQVVLAKGPPPGTGTGDVKANIMIMLDDSGSMWSTDPSPGLSHASTSLDIANNGNIFVSDLRFKITQMESNYNIIHTYGAGSAAWDAQDNGNPPMALYHFQYAGVELDQADPTDEYFYVGGDYQTGGGAFSPGSNIQIKKVCTGIATTSACPKKGVLVAANNLSTQHRIQNLTVSGNYVYGRLNNGSLTQYQKSNLAFVRSRSDITSGSQAGNYDWNWNDLEAVGGYIYITSLSRKLCKYNAFDLSDATFTGGAHCLDLGYSPRAAGVSGRTTPSSADDFLYTWDNNNLRKHDLSSGAVLITKSVRGTSPGQVFDSTAIATDKNGNVYIPEQGNSSRLYLSKFDADLNYISRGPSNGSQGNRMAVAHAAIRSILTDPDLTSGADFGIMSWGSRFNIRTQISPQGANEILTTTLAQIRPNGLTYLGQALQHLRTTYWHNNAVTPIDSSAACQGNFNLIISDGHYWGSPSPETEMPILSKHATMPVKSFIVGLGNSIAGSHAYVNLATVTYGDTTPPGALFANNVSALTLQLRSAILAAINGKLTFTSPKVDFNATPNGFICQPSFKYKNEDQWEGLLTRFSLKADGSIDDPLGVNPNKTLSFNEMLNIRSSLASMASGRKIWTVDDGIDNPASGPNKNNNFDPEYITSKGDNMVEDSTYNVMMGSNTHLGKRDVARIMKYMRGQDMFDSNSDCSASTDAISYTDNCYTEEKGGTTAPLLYKLNDLYNSTPGYIGKPSASTSTDIQNTESEYRHDNNYDTFKTNKANRKNVLLIGSNGGMIHAFDNGCTPQGPNCPVVSSPGTELWAFVPPPVLKQMQHIVSPQMYSKLEVPLSASDTQITVNNASSFPSAGIVRINEEFIKYTSKVSHLANHILSGLTRSYDCSNNAPFCSGTAGTTGSSHIVGSIIFNESEVRKPKYSVYSVDGPIVSKDIYTNGKWKTIAMVGYGKGGRGFTVLNVTNPDNPIHMFSLVNDVQGPGKPRSIKLWQTLGNVGASTVTTTLKQFDYNTVNVTTTLTVAASSSEQASLTVANASGFKNTGFINVLTTSGETEIIQYGSKSGNDLLSLVRSQDVNGNSSPIALDVGSIVTQDSSCTTSIGSVPPKYDYRRLALTTSTPHILNIKNASGQKKWVAVFGAGHNYGVDCLTGNAVYVMDLEDDPGTLIKEIIIPDDPTNTIHNAVQSTLTIIQRDATAKADYYGALAYVTDLENKLWKIDLTEKAGTNLGRKIHLFSDLATAANGRRNYQQLTAVLDSSQSVQVGGGQTESNILRLYWGTGDMANLADRSSTILNRMYGISDMTFKDFNLSWKSASDTLLTTAMFNAGNCLNSTALTAGCPVLNNAGNIGWYNNLPKFWKVTGKKVLYDKEQVYFVIYEPTTKLCSPGDAILGSYQYMCPNQRRLVIALGAGLASGVSTQGSQIYVGVSNAGALGTYSRGNIIEQSGSDFGGLGGSAATIANQVNSNSKGTDGLIVLSPVGTQSTGVSTIDAWKDYMGENYYNQ